MGSYRFGVFSHATCTPQPKHQVSHEGRHRHARQGLKHQLKQLKRYAPILPVRAVCGGSNCTPQPCCARQPHHKSQLLGHHWAPRSWSRLWSPLEGLSLTLSAEATRSIQKWMPCCSSIVQTSCMILLWSAARAHPFAVALSAPRLSEYSTSLRPVSWVLKVANQSTMASTSRDII